MVLPAFDVVSDVMANNYNHLDVVMSGVIATVVFGLL